MKRIEPNLDKQPLTHANGILDGEDLYIAGQVGIDPSTGATIDGIASQAAQSLVNLISVVSAAGGDVKSIVKLTVYVADMAAFQKETAAFMKAFSDTFCTDHIPAMTLVGVTALMSPAYLVEIEGHAKIRAQM